MANNLKKGVFSSILLLVKSLADKLIGLVSTLILARILAPEDFGIIAIATLVMGLLDILSETGASSYLLKEDTIDDQKVNTTWTLNLLLKTALSVLLVISSPFVVSLYDDPRVHNVLIAFAAVFCFKAFKNPGLFYLTRSQSYGKQVQVGLIAKVASVGAAVGTAIVCQSYWALVIGQVINALFMVVGSYIISSYRPTLQLTNVKAQLAFSIWMIPQAIAGYARTQLDTFIVSSQFGQSVLGSYHTMKYVAFIPSSHILLPLSWPFLVEIRAVKHDKQLFLKRALGSSLLLLGVSIPITVILFTQSLSVTWFLLGEQWLEYHYILGLFALLIPAFVLTNEANRLLVIYGMTKQLFFVDLSRSTIVYTSIFILGFESIDEFIVNFVYLEAGLALIYYLIVVWRFFGIFPLTRCLGYFTLFSTIALVNHTIADVILQNVMGHQILQVAVYSLVFIIGFIICLAPTNSILKKHSQEWEYLSSLVERIILPALNKLRLV
tara:strand:+ start:6704 stop:8188 length:1485 start_codon:yes stop_codon:yes gene_type:complete